MIENLHKAFLSPVERIEELNFSAITTLRDIYRRGRAAARSATGSTRSTCTCRSARCASSTSPRATFSRIFKREMEPGRARAPARMVLDTIMRYVKSIIMGNGGHYG